MSDERIVLDLDWDAEYVEPGTLYEDEPAEPVRPGWWVRGFTPSGNPDVEIHVASGAVYDVKDNDRSQDFAELLADLVADATSPNPDIVLRMTPAVAARVHDMLIHALHGEARDGEGSLHSDVVSTVAELDGQLRTGGHRG